MYQFLLSSESQGFSVLEVGRPEAPGSYLSNFQSPYRYALSPRSGTILLQLPVLHQYVVIILIFQVNLANFCPIVVVC